MFNKRTVMLYSLILLIALYIPSFSQTVAGYDLNAQIPMRTDVKTGMLENGLHYYILQNKKPENRAELHIVVRAGSLQEADDQQGLAHFTEHMAFNGTKDFPKDQLVNFLESTGVRFGADLNAYTTFDRTYYMLTIPLDKDGLLDKGLLVLEDWLSGISFDAEEIEKERGVIMEEWRLRTATVQGRAQKAHFPKYLGDSRYGIRMPIGDTAVIQTAPKEAFTRFFNDYYRPNISALIVVGDINTSKIEAKIKKNFSDIKNPANPKPIEDYDIEINPKPVVSVFADKEMPMPNTTLIFKRKANSGKSGTYGEYRYHIMQSLFNTIFSYRLDEISHKSDSPYLFAGGQYSSFLAKDLEAFNLVVVPKTDQIEAGYKKIIEEGFRLTRHGVTDTELERAKVELLNNMEKALKEKDKTESTAFAQELGRHFYEGESVPGIELEYKMYKDFLPGISSKEINDYLRPLMNDAGLVIAASLPEKEDIKVPSESDLLAMYNEVKNSNITPYEDIDASKPLMSTTPKAGSIESKKDDKKVGVTELTLSNGIKVLLKQTDFKNDEIGFSAYKLGGTSLASDDDFLSAQLVAGIVNESGLGEFDAPTLTKMLQGKTVNVRPNISAYTESLSGQCSPKDMETMFQMIYMYYNNPRKDVDAFKTYISMVKESIQNSGSNPNSVFSDTVSAVMGNYHKRAMPLTLDDLSKVDLDKAFNFYNKAFSDANGYTFIFVGNFDYDNIKPYIETYIASLKSNKNSKPAFKDLGIKSPEGNLSREVKKGIEPRSTVQLIINGPFDCNFNTRFNMRVMSEVLSIRLREVLREDMGGVYGVGARPSTTKYPKPRYSFYISFITGPEKVESLINAVKDVIAEVKAGKFDDINIEKVKEILTRENEVNLKENRYWLNNLYTFSYYGESIDQIAQYGDLINTVNKNMVVDAANKYLNMNSFKEFVLNPED